MFCNKSSTCRDGGCIRLAVPAPAPTPPKSDCDPPFTLDVQREKHFKIKCYAK